MMKFKFCVKKAQPLFHDVDVDDYFLKISRWSKENLISRETHVFVTESEHHMYF